jgi:hypothetical protein
MTIASIRTARRDRDDDPLQHLDLGRSRSPAGGSGSSAGRPV